MIELLLAQLDGVSAIPGAPESGGGYVGAVSHLIGATLQTAGLFAQSEILVNFRPLLELSGAMIYTVALLGAVASIALFGNYRSAIYLILGPALFYFMLGTTVEGRATLLRTGERIVGDSAEDQRRLLAIMGDVDENEPNPRLSWFFVRFDAVVSEFVQNFVALLMNTENNEDMAQAATERVFSRVLLAQGVEKGFVKLVSVGVIGQCGEVNRLEIQAARLGGSSGARAAERDLLVARFEQLRAQENLVLDTEVVRYLQTLQPNDEQISTCGGDLETILEIDSLSATTRSRSSCEKVWIYTCLGALEEAENAQRAATTDVALVGSDHDTGGEDSGIPWDRVRQDVRDAIAGDAPSGQATQLLAAHILKNTLSQTSHGQMTAQLSNRTPFNAERYDRVFGKIAEADAKGGRMKIVAFAGSLPYIHGLLLFILAASFPFFTMFLLMPGRWTAFFTWMSLWFWVKSWDIGFAVVHFIREFLWDYMQSGGSCGQGGVDWTEPSSVYSIITECDPLASHNTFYHIIALLTLSVPVITAHLCTGASHLYSAFKGSIDTPAERHGGRYQAERRQLEVTTPIESQLDVEQEQYALNEAAKAAGSPADLSGGVSQFAKADGTLPRNIEAAYEKGKWDYKMNQANSGRLEYMRGAAAESNFRKDNYLDHGGHASDHHAKGETLNNYLNKVQGATIGDPTSTMGTADNDTLGTTGTSALGAGGDETAQDADGDGE